MAHKERLSRIRRRIFLSAMLAIFSGTMFLVLRDAVSRPFGLILGFICGIGIGVMIEYYILLIRARQNMEGVMFASYGISWWLIEQKQNREAIDYD